MGASCCKPEVRPFPLRFACPRTLRLAPWPARASERASKSVGVRSEAQPGLQRPPLLFSRAGSPLRCSSRLRRNGLELEGEGWDEGWEEGDRASEALPRRPTAEGTIPTDVCTSFSSSPFVSSDCPSDRGCRSSAIRLGLHLIARGCCRSDLFRPTSATRRPITSSRPALPHPVALSCVASHSETSARPDADVCCALLLTPSFRTCFLIALRRDRPGSSVVSASRSTLRACDTLARSTHPIGDRTNPAGDRL